MIQITRPLTHTFHDYRVVRIHNQDNVETVGFADTVSGRGDPHLVWIKLHNGREFWGPCEEGRRWAETAA